MKIISHRKQLLFHDPGSSVQAPSVNRAWNTWPGSAEVATGWNFRGSGKKNCSIRTHFQRANLATDSFLYAVWIDILFYCHFFVLFFFTQSVKRSLFLSGYVSFSGMPLSLSRASPTISTGQQIRQWVRDRLWRTYSAVCLELFSPLVIISDERLQVNPENLAVLYLFP